MVTIVEIQHHGDSYQHGELSLRTQAAHEFCDLTDAAAEFVAAAEMEQGMLLVQCLHTTAGLAVTEVETGLRHDFAEIADDLIPRQRSYRHDDLSVRWENLCPEDAEAPNGHSHLQNSAFGLPSVVLGVHAGRLVLGRWQRLVLIEFDRARLRRVVMQLFGTGAMTSVRLNGAAPAAPAPQGDLEA
jgi:secondary thiamine-phosphate synthase enzyme